MTPWNLPRSSSSSPSSSSARSVSAAVSTSATVRSTVGVDATAGSTELVVRPVRNKSWCDGASEGCDPRCKAPAGMATTTWQAVSENDLSPDRRRQSLGRRDVDDSFCSNRLRSLCVVPIGVQPSSVSVLFITTVIFNRNAVLGAMEPKATFTVCQLPPDTTV